MNNKTMKTQKEEYDQLIQAACKTAGLEMEKLVQVSISALKQISPTEIYVDIYARNLWDEYCWHLEVDPYEIDYMGLNTTSDGFDDVLDTVILDAISKIPQHTLLFLSIYSKYELDLGNCLGSNWGIDQDEIVAAVKKRVEKQASRRNVEIIGPDRAEEIAMEISLGGLAGEALSYVEETYDFLSEHSDLMLEGGDSNIDEVSHSLLERYVELLHEDQDDLLLTLFTRFEKEIREMVLEKDILPTVKAITDQLNEDL